MKKSVYTLMILLVIILVACEANTYTEISASTPSTATNSSTTTPVVTTPTSGTTVTYTKDVQTIISNNCLSCHGAGGDSPTLTSYTLVKNAASNGKLLCTIQASGCKTMPQAGKMPQATINIILSWVSQGYIQ